MVSVCKEWILSSLPGTSLKHEMARKHGTPSALFERWVVARMLLTEIELVTFSRAACTAEKVWIVGVNDAQTRLMYSCHGFAVRR